MAQQIFVQAPGEGAGLIRAVGVDAAANPVERQHHLDTQGSVLAITDGSQTIETAYQIDAWGNVLSGSAAGNSFDYVGGAGYWRDPDLGFSYVRARWLDTETGTWLSADPLLEEPAYSYAYNSPTAYTDASGMASVDSLISNSEPLIGVVTGGAAGGTKRRSTSRKVRGRRVPHLPGGRARRRPSHAGIGGGAVIFHVILVQTFRPSWST